MDSLQSDKGNGSQGSVGWNFELQILEIRDSLRHLLVSCMLTQVMVSGSMWNAGAGETSGAQTAYKAKRSEPSPSRWTTRGRSCLGLQDRLHVGSASSPWA